jgi:hypothetical protein
MERRNLLRPPGNEENTQEVVRCCQTSRRRTIAFNDAAEETDYLSVQSAGGWAFDGKGAFS